MPHQTQTPPTPTANGQSAPLRDSETDSRMLRTLIGNLDGMVFRCCADALTSMEFVSDGCVALTGYQPAELLADGAHPYGTLILAEDQERAPDSAPRTTSPAAGHRYSIEYRIRRADGEERLVWERGMPVLDAAGDIIAYEGFIEDITERRRYRTLIEQQASYDALTGLANRRLLNDRLTQAISRSQRTHEHVAVAFIDLDNFKTVNDTCGHEVGDQLIKEMARRLQASVRQSDTVARLGGDEFVLLLTRYGSNEELTRVLQRVQTIVADPWTHGRREFQITSSCGAALYPDDGDTAEALLRNADAAMYRAKGNGRNNLQLFTSEINRAMLARVGIEHRLRKAIARDQLELYYQPRIDVASGRMVAAEALLRWQLPKQGTITPSLFIAVAEETGLIVPIGRWALDTACRQAQAWRSAGLPPMVISVNVSPRQFRHGDIVATIAAALRDSGLPAHYLQIELTEGLAMQGAEQHIAMLNDVKALGVQIAIDDFGTGYSSLSYLKRFPVDQLKVDRSFVHDLPGNADDVAIVRAIVTLGHQLGLRVVAEGVENDAQNALLRGLGCDEMQGYLFGRPMPASRFTEYVQQSRNSYPDLALPA
jgi:diguanylate cyclase (GGDEF)-like protein/PAS domain S-box-containing protein